MEHRFLGRSGFKIPALTFGTGTFGGSNDFFKPWGNTDVAEATRLVDICLDAGLTMFDSAASYSAGAAEDILGGAIKGRRDKVLISTKAAFRSGPDVNDVGISRFTLIRTIDASARAIQNGTSAPPVPDELFYAVTDVLDRIAAETGKSMPQIALNWVLTRPTVSTVIIGARNEAQLRENLGALGWSLSPQHMADLDAVSRPALPYP